MCLRDKQLWLVGVACLFLFVLLRVLFLEWDLPPLEVTSYFVEDELFYSAGGFSLFNDGAIIHRHLDWVKSDASTISSPLLTVISYLGITAFDNNFYAIRIPSVCAGLITFLVCFGLLINIRDNEKDSHVNAITIALLFLALNFSFVMASRVFEPTIFRLSVMMICLYLAIKLTPSDRLMSPVVALLLGVIAGAGFIFVYITNFFVPAAMVFGVFIVSLAYGAKNAFIRAFICGLGVLLSLFLYHLYSLFLFDQSPFTGLADAFRIYKHRTAVDSTHYPIVAKLFLNILKTPSGNIFRFNTALYFFFLLSIPLYVRLVIVNRRTVDLYIFSFWFLFSMQSVFVNDFPVRKQIMLLPFVILMLYSSYLNRKTLMVWLHSSPKVRRWAKIISAIIIFLALAHLFVSTLVSGWHESPIDKSRSMMIFSTSTLSTLLAILLAIFWYRGKDEKSQKLIYVVLIAMFIPELYLDYRYIFKEPTFKRRDAMMAVAPLIDGKQVVGCESIGMRLYNNATIYLNPFRYLVSEVDKGAMHDGEYGETIRRLVKENRVDYTFCRLDETRFDMAAMDFELIETYDINNDPGRKLGLYRPKRVAEEE